MPDVERLQPPEAGAEPRCQSCAVRRRCAAARPPADDGPICPIAVELERAAAEEAIASGQLVRLAQRLGLTDPAIAVVIEDARRRYDLRVAAHQLVRALAGGEAA